MYRHILLATDGSPCALRAAVAAAEIACTYRSKVTIIHVQLEILANLGLADATLAEQYIDVQEQNCTAEYEQVIAMTRPAFDKREVEFDAVQAHGYSGDVISAVAAQCGADLIVVGHRGLSALQSIVLGSTSERIVHTAKCSVLVVR